MDEGKLGQTLEKMREMKNLFLNDYMAGLMDERALREVCTSELWSMFEDGLRELGLRRNEPITNESMRRYEEDYELWVAGEEPASPAGEPWLMRVSDGGGSLDEASASERAAYFLLAREALYEIVVWEIPPDGMERPVRHVGVYGNGMRVVVPFDCVDDDGLVECEDPCGRRFTLTDSKGLHAVLLVDEPDAYPYRRSVWEKGSNCNGLVSVEGYTVPGFRSEGCVSIANGKVASITYYNSLWTWCDNPHLKELCSAEEYAAFLKERESRDDSFTVSLENLLERNEEAFRSFPRWQPYFQWSKAHPPRTVSPSFEEYVQQLVADCSA